MALFPTFALMRIHVHLLTLFCVGLFFTSCIKDVEMKTARAGNKFLVDVPKSMADVQNLKNGADIQLQGKKDFPLFFYGFCDEKNASQSMGVNFTTDEIYYLEAEEILATGTGGKVSLPKEKQISYFKCSYGQVSINRKGEELLHEIYICEGSTRFYRLVIGGKPLDMKEHEKTAKEIVDSFREWTEFQVEGIQ